VGWWVKKKTAPNGVNPSGESSTPAAKPKKKKQATSLAPQKEDSAWQALDRRLGGREGLLEAAVLSPNPKAAILAELLLDPAFRTAGTKALAKRAGLTAPEVVDLFRDAKWLESTIILHEKLPSIIDGATDDAKPKMRPCEECKGKGKQEDGTDCWVCGGWGSNRVPGDKDKLSFVGEAVGMTGKKGPLIQNNQQVINMPGQASNSFEDMVKRATIDVLKPKQIEAAEAEVVKDE